MHELGIAKELFNIILQTAKENSIKSISKIVIKVGVNSGIDPKFLEHSFKDHILPDSIAKNSELKIVIEPIKLKCNKCGKIMNYNNKNKSNEIHNLSSNCPHCKSSDLQIISGKDVYVDTIESDE
jgi:hydrogenase nickel incorporation protein HypA/HybF